MSVALQKPGFALLGLFHKGYDPFLGLGAFFINGTIPYFCGKPVFFGAKPVFLVRKPIGVKTFIFRSKPLFFTQNSYFLKEKLPRERPHE